MRKTLLALSAAAALALAAPAAAQDRAGAPPYYAPGMIVGGAVVGTTVGLGLYHGWWGSGKFVSSLPSSAAGSAAVGGVAGIGTIALVDAAVQPCRGLRALFVAGASSGCRDDQYVGYTPVRRGGRG
jgi:hypothetical protein